MDDFKAVLHNPDGHQLLAVVASVHHQGVDQTFDNWALSLAEPFGGVTTRAMGKELGEFLLDSNLTAM